MVKDNDVCGVGVAYGSNIAGKDQCNFMCRATRNCYEYYSLMLTC